MTESQFHSLCPEGFLDAAREVISEGFADYAREYSHVADINSPRTVKNAIHDHIAHRARMELCPDPLSYRFIQQRHIFFLREKCVIVFKKLDEQLQSSNYPTTAARKFSQQAELEGIPVPRIEFGYVPDPLGASLNGVYAVYKLGKKIDWFIDLNQGDAPSQADIISA